VSAIKTPLTHHDADVLLEGLVYGSARAQAIRVLMAVDVASREAERERCAQLAEDVGDACDYAGDACAVGVAKTIRDPDAIPAPRPGALEQLQASLGISPKEKA